jgi:hypothetical protein
MSERKSVTSKVTTHRFSNLVASVVGHLTATALFFVLFSSLFMSEQTLGLLQVGLRDDAMRPDILAPAVLIFGLAGCAWALMFIMYQLGKSRVHQGAHVKLKKARGTVITETLVVLPIFFCLTFGLAQMALNSIAGILSTLASYEVTRTLAVWAVEENNSRSPSGGAITHQQIQQRARLHAAMVIAPVTPEFSLAAPCQLGSVLPQALAGLVGVNVGGIPTGQGSVFSMAEAFGHRTFSERGPAKLTGAYCAIEVDWNGVITDPQNVNRSPITSTLQYHHPVAMPVVGWVFAKNPGAGPWATPYVSTIRRTYRLTTYVTPNVELPY